MLQGLVSLVPLQIELAKIHVNFSCLDVIWAQNLHATKQRTLVKIHRFLILPFRNQKISHQSINRHMKWMTRTQMVKKCVRRYLEKSFALFEIVQAIVSPDENTIKSNSLSMKWQNIHQGLLSVFDGLLILLLFKCNFTNIS